MSADTRFPRPLPTRPPAPFPPFIETVEEAIDCVQELPRETMKAGPWREAFAALWNVVDAPEDARALAVAETALRAALAAQGWLGET